ncbi:MAG: VWA domain-containing protein [Candidatus Latescibacteria bacterium]|nr:VWA domain-containing protein [bacterium]MBD3424748.1 VWA domain-containing protein [Candidatus Latescibacterota bacterium]
MRFANPWVFLLLALIPLYLFYAARFRKGGSVRFSTLVNAARAGRSVRQRLAVLPAALRVIAIALLVIALARPQMGREKVKDVTRGIAIEMVIDRSGSMKAEMEYKNRRMNRLEVVKGVFREFLLGNGKDLEGRPNDLVGIISFARYADTVAPLTLGHGALLRFLESTRIVKRRSEDGTAIGDAIALAAARLKTAGENITGKGKDPEKSEYNIDSRIIILLTDGQNNFGKRTPIEAAELAAEWGIKIYAIGVGGEGVNTVQTLLGNFKVPSSSRIDMKTLERVAEITNGISRRAEDEESLRKIYQEIDKLEKSKIESVRYVDYREIFVPFALAALILIMLERALAATIFRRLP